MPYRVRDSLRYIIRMKSFFIKISVAVSLLFMVLSCADEDGGKINISPEFSEISLIGTNPKTIGFDSERSWYVRVDYPEGTTGKWLDVSPMTGNAGEGEIILQAVSPNYSSTERRATVNILIPGSMGVQVYIVQEGALKPRDLIRLNRSMSGQALAGPAEMALEYAVDGSVSALLTPGMRYELTKDGNKGTIKTKAGTVEGSFNISLLDGYISSVGPLTWTFKDPNTNIELRVSDVTIDFRYDSGENKRLRSITRTELIKKEDAVELETPRKEQEVYTYTTERLRFVKLERILPFDTSKKEAEFPRDTLIYTFLYPESDASFEDNNVTANVWDLVVFPDNQGTPFYSLTGYWILGLTGVPQNSFPQSAEIEAKIHSGATSAWPLRYRYAFRRNSDNFIEQTSTDIEYGGDVALRMGAITFAYSEDPTEETRQ